MRPSTMAPTCIPAMISKARFFNALNEKGALAPFFRSAPSLSGANACAFRLIAEAWGKGVVRFGGFVMARIGTGGNVLFWILLNFHGQDGNQHP